MDKKNCIKKKKSILNFIELLLLYEENHFVLQKTETILLDFDFLNEKDL